MSVARHPADEAIPTVSVIVPTFHRSDCLKESLRSLLTDPATTELIVVVDGQDEESASVVDRFSSVDPRVTLVMHPHGGKRSALAAGLREATGDVVLLIDDDVVAGPGLVTGHSRRHKQGEHLVVAGYMPCWEAPSGKGVALFTKEYGASYERHCAAVEREPSLLLRQLWGGNVSLRRSDCEAVGFTPWPFRHEDQEFGLRCLRHGMSGLFDRQLYAEHHHSRDTRHFLTDARASGAGDACLRERFTELIGPFDPDDELRIAGPIVRWLLSHMSTPRRSRLVTTPLVGISRAAEFLRIERVEAKAYLIAVRIESRVGSLQFQAQRRIRGA